MLSLASFAMCMSFESNVHSIIDLATAITCFSSKKSLLPVMIAFQVDNMLWQMQDSPMQQLLDDAQREVVADVVNAALLASASGKPKWEVKPQVRKTFCMVSLSPCSFMITPCHTLQQFLVSLFIWMMQW